MKFLGIILILISIPFWEIGRMNALYARSDKEFIKAFFFPLGIIALGIICLLN